MKRTGYIFYPEHLLGLGDYYGEERADICPNMHEFYKGGFTTPEEFNNWRNRMGAQGEMIFAEYLKQQGIPYLFVAIQSHGIHPECDMLICGDYRIDVKSFGTHQRKFMVSKHSHDKTSKKVDYYVFVRMIRPGVARYWVIDYEQVSQWPVNSYHSPCYELKISDYELQNRHGISA